MSHDDMARDSLASVRPIRREIEETFTPWTADPIRLARLLRWLALMDETPESIPDFLEHAEGWQRQYSEMQVWEKS